jgi:hypothetical protein
MVAIASASESKDREERHVVGAHNATRVVGRDAGE